MKYEWLDPTIHQIPFSNFVRYLLIRRTKDALAEWVTPIIFYKGNIMEPVHRIITKPCNKCGHSEAITEVYEFFGINKKEKSKKKKAKIVKATPEQ